MTQPLDSDIVYLHGLRCECTIGVWEWEKAIKQVVTFDLDLACDIRPASDNDELEKALDYQAIAERLISFVEQSRFELIETLAEKVAQLILSEFDTQWIKVRLDKGAAVKGVKSVGIVIERHK